MLFANNPRGFEFNARTPFDDCSRRFQLLCFLFIYLILSFPRSSISQVSEKHLVTVTALNLNVNICTIKMVSTFVKRTIYIYIQIRIAHAKWFWSRVRFRFSLSECLQQNPIIACQCYLIVTFCGNVLSTRLITRMRSNSAVKWIYIDLLL